MGYKIIGINLLRKKNQQQNIIRNIVRLIGGRDIVKRDIRRCPAEKQWLWRIYNNASRKIYHNEYKIRQLKREMRLACH